MTPEEKRRYNREYYLRNKDKWDRYAEVARKGGKFIGRNLNTNKTYSESTARSAYNAGKAVSNLAGLKRTPNILERTESATRSANTFVRNTAKNEKAGNKKAFNTLIERATGAAEEANKLIGNKDVRRSYKEANDFVKNTMHNSKTKNGNLMRKISDKTYNASKEANNFVKNMGRNEKAKNKKFIGKIATKAQEASKAANKAITKSNKRTRVYKNIQKFIKNLF